MRCLAPWSSAVRPTAARGAGGRRTRRDRPADRPLSSSTAQKSVRTASHEVNGLPPASADKQASVSPEAIPVSLVR